MVVGVWFQGERRVPTAFAFLVLASLVYSASHSWFWQRAHDMAWLAGPLLMILVWLLLRRSRVAWCVFFAFSAGGLVSDIIQVSGHRATAAWIVGGVIGLIELGLLASTPMRRFIGFRGWLAPSPS